VLVLSLEQTIKATLRSFEMKRKKQRGQVSLNRSPVVTTSHHRYTFLSAVAIRMRGENLSKNVITIPYSRKYLACQEKISKNLRIMFWQVPQTLVSVEHLFISFTIGRFWLSTNVLHSLTAKLC
jgi:hypothetical protein